MNHLTRKQINIWDNRIRNRAIADIAEAVGRIDLDTMYYYGVLLDEDDELLEIFGPRQNEDVTIALIVETERHAKTLADSLRWDVYTGRGQPGVPCEPTRGIVTLDYARSCGVSAQVIIRADGSPDQCKVNLKPYTGDHSDLILVLDIADGFDDQAVEDTQTRMDEYETLEWIIRQ